LVEERDQGDHQAAGSQIPEALDGEKKWTGKAMDKTKDAGEKGPRTRIDPAGEETRPAYWRTRILPVEEEILRRNKIVSRFPEEAMTDQINLLRTQVLHRMERLGGNTLLVASANHGEGRTFTCLNLAISISHELNQTVLLVDADLRRPSVNRLLGLESRKGLSDYLLGTAEIPDLLLNPGMDKCVVLPAGRPLPNSAELLGSPRMNALVREMKDRYPDRFILFDGPPLLACADSLVISRILDGVLLVTEAEKTPAKDLLRAMDLLKDRPVIGAVLNKARA